MIINFDDYRKTPMIYAEDLNNITTLHHCGMFNTHIPENFIELDGRLLSKDTIIRNENDYFRHFYDEQRQIEMSDEYEKYIKQSWENNKNEDKGE